MGIVAAHTAPNYTFGNYFRILGAQFKCAPKDPPTLWILVGFYANDQARQLNADPMYSYNVQLPVGTELFDGSLVPDLREGLLYDLLMQSPLFGGTAAVPHTAALEGGEQLSLEEIKKLKIAEVNRARLRANRDHFVFQGKKIDADENSMLEIQTTHGNVLALGTLPEGWPGGWVTQDEDFVSIPDVDTWYAFYGAIMTTGQANYARVVELRRRVNLSTTPEQVESFSWAYDLGQPFEPAPVEQP